MAKSLASQSLMWQGLFPTFGGPRLQGRLQDMLVYAILEGFVEPGEVVPSSRQLAQVLGISRSTVTLALQRLCDMGFLIAKPASGYVVHPEVRTQLQGGRGSQGRHLGAEVNWQKRLTQSLVGLRNICKPKDWHRHPYPFVYGQLDQTLFPKTHWRECVAESLQMSAIQCWAPDQIDEDDPALIQQIQQRLLPARGIWTSRDTILITAGAQNANYLLGQLLVDANTVVAMEDPGYPDARNGFLIRSPHIKPVPVDHEGLDVDADLGGCACLYVTPSHQCPTTVTLPLDRRRRLLERAADEDFVIIEDDHESELNFAGRPTAALKSLDHSDRVIYVGSLSKTLCHGLRLGFVVAAPPLISELRRLRRLILRHPSSNNQHVAALFIRHGYQEAYVNRLNRVYGERSGILKAAFERWLPHWEYTPSSGGSAFWVIAPEEIDTDELAKIALLEGIVIEPGRVFYANTAQAPGNRLRIGFSAIPDDRIEPGIRALASLIQRGLV